MAPQHSPLACPETLLEEVDNPSVHSNQETALVTTSERFNWVETEGRVEGEFMYHPFTLATWMYFSDRSHTYHNVIPALPFFPSIFDNNSQRGLPPVTRLFEGDSQPVESDDEAEESDGDSHPPESDDESDKENQDPNGRSNTHATVALVRHNELPREEDFFEVQVVNELHGLARAWRDSMDSMIGRTL